MLSLRRQTILHILVIFIIAGFGVALALNTAHRVIILSSDSITYIDAARHISDGQGFRTGLLTFDDLESNPPLTLWPPLYPMTVAPLIRLGVEPIFAGRMASALGIGLVILVIGLWARQMRGGLVGVLVAGAVLALPAITKSGATVLAEPIFTLLVIASSWVGSLALNSRRRTTWFLFGALLGLCVLARYVGLILICLLFIAIAVRWLRTRQIRETLRSGSIGLLGTAIFVTPLLVRNYFLHQPLGGGERTASTVSIADNLIDATRVLGADFLGWLPIALLILAITGLVVLLLRRSVSRTLCVIRWPLIVVSVYIIGMILVRSVINADPITSRFLMPSYPLIILVLVLVISDATRTLGQKSRVVVLSVTAVLCLASAVKDYDFKVGPYHSQPGKRVEIVEQNTNERDLIIGDWAREYNLFLGRTVIQLPYLEGAPQLTPDRLRELIDRWRPDFDRVIIALTPGIDSKIFGPYVTILNQGESTAVTSLVKTKSLYLFETR